MRVYTLKKPLDVYSANVYYILGDWNTLDDLNTLIEVGINDFIIKELEEINSGVGKRKIDQVILTHDHFDHSAGLKYILPLYNPKVYAFSEQVPNAIKIYDGMPVRLGDKMGMIFYTPGHSNDSISVWEPDSRTLFSGDTMLFIKTPGGSYTYQFYDTIKKIYELKPKLIYPGHGEPISENIGKLLELSLKSIDASHIH